MDKQFGCNWTVKQAQLFPQITYDSFLIQGGDQADEEMEGGDEDSRQGDNVDYD